MQERAIATRYAVMQAAAQLFEERGYAGTSVGDVVRLSGHTSGSVYFHFNSKEGLARAVAEAYHSLWPELIERCMSAPEAVLVRTIALHLAVADAYRDDVLVRAGARLWFERSSIGTPLPAPFAGWITVTRGLLDEARACGEVGAAIDSGRAAHLIVASFFGTHTVDDALGCRDQLAGHVLYMWRLLLPGLGAGDPADVLDRAEALHTQPTRASR